MWDYWWNFIFWVLSDRCCCVCFDKVRFRFRDRTASIRLRGWIKLFLCFICCMWESKICFCFLMFLILKFWVWCIVGFCILFVLFVFRVWIALIRNRWVLSSVDFCRCLIKYFLILNFCVWYFLCVCVLWCVIFVWLLIVFCFSRMIRRAIRVRVIRRFGRVCKL